MSKSVIFTHAFDINTSFGLEVEVRDQQLYIENIVHDGQAYHVAEECKRKGKMGPQIGDFLTKANGSVIPANIKKPDDFATFLVREIQDCASNGRTVIELEFTRRVKTASKGRSTKAAAGLKSRGRKRRKAADDGGNSPTKQAKKSSAKASNSSSALGSATTKSTRAAVDSVVALPVGTKLFLQVDRPKKRAGKGKQWFRGWVSLPELPSLKYAQQYVGSTVSKHFPGYEEEFQGKIKEVWKHKDGAFMFSILYDDGDKEDVTWEELKAIIQ